MVNHMSNGKAMIVHSIAGLIKKTKIEPWFYWMQFHYVKTSQYFPKQYELFSGDINRKVDLSSYATKIDIKNISHIDTSSIK